MQTKTKEIIAHHLRGISTREIAHMYGMKKNTVISVLRYHGVCRKAPGRNIEKQVVDYLKRSGQEVEHMRGDHYFDCLVNGLRAEIKSSSLNNNGESACYRFQLIHKQTLNPRKPDYYYLVFKDTRDIYTLDAYETDTITLTIPQSLRTKYPIEYMGNLDDV